MSQSPREYARAHRSESLDRLKSFLEVPSVSAVPERRGDVRAAAEWLANRMREAGIPNVEVDATEGHPIVAGHWIVDPDAPTVLVYGHYDVQPAEPLDEWDSPPFEPTLRNGALYARGASDDKGQVLAHIEAVRAFHATAGQPPVNMRFVIEGEEEVGSPNLDPWLEEHADALDADVAVISDSAMAGRDQPSVVYGLRGLTYMEVHVKGPNRDLHSGQFGGAVRNPIHVLAEILTALHDEDGRITIPGFYDNVIELSSEEREVMSETPFDQDAFEGATGRAGGWGERGYTVVERLGARPTLDANGIWGGWTGDGAKTVIPAAAHAKVSMRLVPDQDPGRIAKLFDTAIQDLAPDWATVETRELHGGWPVLVDRSIPAMQAAKAAYAEVFGKEPVFTREGGTIPVVASLHRLLGVETILMGFGLPDDNLHAPNEKFDVDNYHAGVETLIEFLERLRSQPTSPA